MKVFAIFRPRECGSRGLSPVLYNQYNTLSFQKMEYTLYKQQLFGTKSTAIYKQYFLFLSEQKVCSLSLHVFLPSNYFTLGPK